MPALRNLCICTTVLCCSILQLKAQLSSKDSSLLKSSINNALSFYDKNIGEQSGKFNGSQNIGYPQGVIEKNPYFQSPNFSKGYILYNQVYYPNVNLLYDEAADLVVLQDSSHKIELISEKLDGFGIKDSKFQYLLRKDANSNDLLNTGFYQVLVEGNASLYKKESKKITEKIVGSELTYLIETYTYYYLLKQNKYTEIQSKKTIFRLLKDKEKELKKYAKTQHLNYRKDKDNMLSNVAEYYNLLTK
ncbi:MAG: hypothetical protein WCO28_08455 [Bacteroidota bacterium]|jgi:hypothetical protein